MVLLQLNDSPITEISKWNVTFVITRASTKKIAEKKDLIKLFLHGLMSIIIFL